MNRQKCTFCTCSLLFLTWSFFFVFPPRLHLSSCQMVVVTFSISIIRVKWRHFIAFCLWRVNRKRWTWLYIIHVNNQEACLTLSEWQKFAVSLCRDLFLIQNKLLTLVVGSLGSAVMLRRWIAGRQFLQPTPSHEEQWGRTNTVGAAPGFSFRVPGSKYSLPKCWQQRWELGEATHWLRVRWTCFSHLRNASMSFGNLNSVTPSSAVLPHP